ncbi:M14 family metallopeptidase [Arenimonas alkanexedens]
MAAADDALVTVSEQSGFTRTGRYAEVGELCEAFATRHPQAVRCFDFGTTPQGRTMKALVASTSGALDPAAARQRGLPVVLVQGGIHAGEIDGKDAGFLALREVLAGDAAPGALDKLVLVFVPVFNVDGHERFGAWNRPNQRGPVEMGWRTTAQNFNLNRDYLKVDSPEMQAMLALVNAWDPLAVVDLHATNGAQFEHDIAIQVEPVHAGPTALREIGRQWRDGVIADLAAQGSMPLAFYPSFESYDDPASGFSDSVAPPRFSTGYFWLRNRLAMLVETHSWRPYPERVRSTRNTVVSVLEHMAENGQAWQQAIRAADIAASQPDAAPVPLSFEVSDQVRMIEFRGYAYTREPSDVSGALMTRYDESTPQVWTVPMRDDVRPALSVPMPGAGYLVPAEHAAKVAAKLGTHGVDYRVLPDQGELDVQAFRATSQQLSAGSVEGHQTLSVTGAWAPERRQIGPGALFVPIRQPKSRLVMAMLEPQAPDSLLAWGEFNNHFEPKEYMEAYVAEDVARAMLAKDPALRAAFEQRLAEDAAFAASPSARLQFFYRRHTSWDERLGLYPVLRVDAAPR